MSKKRNVWMKKWSITAAGLLLAAVISGCGTQAVTKQIMEENSVPETEMAQETESTANQEAAAIQDKNSTVPGAKSEMITVTDREGKQLQIPADLTSIVSMAPSVTETLIHLGLADRLTGVDSYSVGIEGLPEGLPVYDMMTPDTESLAALKPDLIIATGMSKSGGEDPFSPVTELGVTMTYIPSPADLNGIKEDIRFLGELTQTEEKANELIAAMEKEIQDIVSMIPQNEPKQKVLFEVAAAPDIYSFGTDTFLNEMLVMLGAENILADQSGWLSVSEETVIAANPDVIFTNVDYIENPDQEILGRNGWDAINAVSNKRVYIIDKNASSRPNESVSTAFRQMAEALYPDLFS